MDNNQEPVTQTEEKTEDKTVTQSEEKTEAREEKSFTQADMNKLEMKIEKKFKEKYKGYDEWLETQKTETEKSLEKDKKIEALEKKLTYAENKSIVADASVDSKFRKFVLTEVSELEGDFEENLKDYLKENPQYLQTTTSTPQTTGVAVSKIKSEEEDGVMAILKSKHPESF